MLKRLSDYLLLSLFLICMFAKQLSAAVVNNIEITGNERISDETVIMFSEISLKDDLSKSDINLILKRLFDTNFFEDVSVEFSNNVLSIKVIENPIIDKIIFKGIKADKIKKEITNNLILKTRSSYTPFILQQDKNNVSNVLKKLGYYHSEIDIFIEDLSDNRIILTYDISLGEKSKIKKISFLGDKKFKDSKLRSLIISEEHKFWKFISGKKYLNETTTQLDQRLLKNFYLNKGYYDVEINSSFARLINKNEFELIFNIDAKEKYFFDSIDLNLPIDFNKENFSELQNIFNKLKDEPYSLRAVDKILKEINIITTNEEYHSMEATVEEIIKDNRIKLVFNINETDKIFIEKINIFGNNVTNEKVIRNQLLIDEGDPFNDILQARSINNLKNLNYFKSVNSEIVENNQNNTKIINIFLEEKPTGEISAGAGVGTSGGSIGFGVKENNYLGKGIFVEANGTLTEESIKGLLTIKNPNYQNTNNSLDFTIEATEVDRLTDFGYKNNKVGFSIGTGFEFLDDLNLGLATSTYYEKIETNSTASARQKKQEGNYFDTFLNLDLNYDKRNQKFQTSDGFYSRYSIAMPIISESNTLTNSYDYKIYSELYDQNVSTASFFFMAANSLTNDDVKLSERLYVPSKKLRGFERGKIGPLDGDDYIGGNFVSAINFTSSLPQLMENSQNVDFTLFLDIANVWGVDYDSSIESNDNIRSSIGLGVDWFTLIGPLNFSFATPISKDNRDKTETFRFNLGTTF